MTNTEDNKAKILIIDDEESIRLTFKNFLLHEGYIVTVAGDYHEALEIIERTFFDLIFADIILKGKTGIDVLRETKERNSKCQVIMITGAPDIETASEAVRLGAFDYVTKPVFQDTLLRVTKSALQHKKIIDENDEYRSNIEAIFKSVKDAIITVDKDLNIIEINEAAKVICNLTRDSIGKKMNSLLKYCNGKCVNTLEETIRRKQSIEIYHNECRHEHRTQQVVNLVTHPLINNQEDFIGAVLVIRDETRMADLERRMRERQRFNNIIGHNKQMQTIYSLIESLANVQTTVLITGESGTGKELVAEAIHCKGNRVDKPLIKVHCAALSENLLESELFGHVKGAFTGAINDRIGRFEMANGGTIFLDEIGDLSPKLQVQLLRVIQERTFEKVGDSTPVKVDVRIIAATNKNLPEKIKHGEYREDLYYRLNVIELKLPPLRSRKEDIPLLARHFVNKFNMRFNKNIEGISNDVLEKFMEYSWPGNIRELEHSIEHSFVLCNQNVITLDHLPDILEEMAGIKKPLHEDAKARERTYIIHALEKCSWNKAETARQLGMSRRNLYRKIKDYNIKILYNAK